MAVASTELLSTQDLASFLALSPSHLHIATFYASWDVSRTGGPLDAHLVSLARSHGDVFLARIDAEAEETAALTEAHEVTVVPTFLFFKHGALVDRLEGPDSAELGVRVSRHAKVSAPAAVVPTVDKAAPDALTARLDHLVNAAPLMAFIKGTPSEPRCGFSKRAVALLQEWGAPFGSFDILSDEAVRNGLKARFSWPTFPMVVVNGALVGGLDVLQEYKDSGSLGEVLPPPPRAQQPQGTGSGALAVPAADAERANALSRSADVVLFMKGDADAPACGFSERAVALLRSAGVAFTAVDVLRDLPVREALKALHDFPTFPMLFAKGALVGGVEALKEAVDGAASGGTPLRVALGLEAARPGAPAPAAAPAASPAASKERLLRLVSAGAAVLFMKGMPAVPRCGFSSKAVALLESLGVDVHAVVGAENAPPGTRFAAFDILEDEGVRSGLKALFSWPTYPQLYVKGELVGGLDVLQEMGDELRDQLVAAGATAT